MAGHPKISVVIVDFNGWEDTSDAIKSIFEKEPHRRLNIIVIDNGSQQVFYEELEKLARSYRRAAFNLSDGHLSRMPFRGEVIYKRLSENKGFAGGSNEGIRMSLEWGSDYVWLLNNDTIIEKMALTYLVLPAEHPDLKGKVAIVGSKLHCYPEKDKVQFDGFSVNYDGKGRGEQSRGGLSQTHFVSGASMLIKSDFLRRHGLLREDYFLYFEDNEICLRASKLGYMVLFNPFSVVYHKGGSSTGGFMVSPISVYYFIRNGLFFYSEFGDIGKALYMLKLAKAYIDHFAKNNDYEKIEVTVKAIRDFILGKMGHMNQPKLLVGNVCQEFTGKLSIVERSLLKQPVGSYDIELYFSVVENILRQKFRKDMELRQESFSHGQLIQNR